MGLPCLSQMFWTYLLQSMYGTHVGASMRSATCRCCRANVRPITCTIAKNATIVLENVAPRSACGPGTERPPISAAQFHARCCVAMLCSILFSCEILANILQEEGGKLQHEAGGLGMGRAGGQLRHARILRARVRSQQNRTG